MNSISVLTSQKINSPSVNTNQNEDKQINPIKVKTTFNPYFSRNEGAIII